MKAVIRDGCMHIITWGATARCGVIVAQLSSITFQLVPMATASMMPASNVLAADERSDREQAWKRIQPLLADADDAANKALDRHIEAVRKTFVERPHGIRVFASRLLSLRGKSELAKNKATSAWNDFDYWACALLDGKLFQGRMDELRERKSFLEAMDLNSPERTYMKWVSEEFEKSVIAPKEIQQAVASSSRGYLSDLAGIENRLLIRVRADLAESDLPALSMIPALKTDSLLKQRYEHRLKELQPLLDRDLQIAVGREVIVFAGSEVATAVVARVGTAVASRFGASAGILTAGAASSWTNFGIGLVAGIVLDEVAERIMKAAGYDAEAKLAARIRVILENAATTVIEGDPAARENLKHLQAQARNSPDRELRKYAAEGISYYTPAMLYGLRGELLNLTKARAKLRNEALKRLICEPVEVKR